ncbi:MAG: Mur ligase family protein [Armatimonadetes bacterium]|nr:Mur ligase family protein [Armatimonadota bacterium]
MRMGGGTTMPGRVARAIEPRVVPTLAGRLRHGTMVVTGTNGKTTTSRLVAHILEHAGLVPIHNRAGANLAAGIAAALVEHATLGGVPRGDVGVFEVDEATLPRVVDGLRPRAVILTNLFRDQLDRYGEIDLVAAGWRQTVSVLPASATVILNADDPLVADVAGAVRAGGAEVLAFGVEDPACGLGAGEGGAPPEHTAEARYCYRCGRPYLYTTVYYGHMGHYRCSGCDAARPAPQVVAREVRLRGIEGTRFLLEGPGAAFAVRTVLPGLYNVYNILAACACCLAMGVAPETVERAVENFTPAFGRAEQMRIDGREAVMLLAKNPAGFNEVLRTVLRSGEAPVVLIAINDLTADGRDISWLWDVDFEMLAGRAQAVVDTGIRGEDMALRLKYAGVAEERVLLEKDWERALRAALERVPEDKRLFILPTYTAMLHLRGILQRLGVVEGFWRQ